MDLANSGNASKAAVSKLKTRIHVHICVQMTMAFEWDEAKRAANLRAHGVDFEDAALIFASPVIEADDTRADYGESRLRAVGQVAAEFFMVAYT